MDSHNNLNIQDKLILFFREKYNRNTIMDN